MAGSYTYDQKTSLEGWLIKPRPNGPQLEVRLPEVLNATGTGALIWNLVHGKFGFFGTGLAEFDAGLVFGIGAVMTTVTDKAKKSKPKFSPSGSIGADVFFYLSDSWALRADYRQFFYPADGGGVSFPIAVTLGLTYFTAAPY